MGSFDDPTLLKGFLSMIVHTLFQYAFLYIWNYVTLTDNEFRLTLDRWRGSIKVRYPSLCTRFFARRDRTYSR